MASDVVIDDLREVLDIMNDRMDQTTFIKGGYLSN